MYSTGDFSDKQIADWMNQQPLIQALRAGRQPMNKEMVRDMLQNRVYTGRVPYAETLYNGTLGESKQSARGRKMWYDGKHQGFISQEEYVGKRQQLQLEMDALRPIDYDELIEAADLIENFQTYWEQCDAVDKPLDARQQLLQKIVERVFVHEGEVLAVVVHGDFGIVLGKDEQETAEIARVLDIKDAATSEVSPRSRHGSDGHRIILFHLRHFSDIIIVSSVTQDYRSDANCAASITTVCSIKGALLAGGVIRRGSASFAIRVRRVSPYFGGNPYSARSSAVSSRTMQHSCAYAIKSSVVSQTCHILAMPSAPAVAIRSPSGDHAAVSM